MSVLVSTDPCHRFPLAVCEGGEGDFPSRGDKKGNRLANALWCAASEYAALGFETGYQLGRAANLAKTVLTSAIKLIKTGNKLYINKPIPFYLQLYSLCSRVLTRFK